MIKKDNLGKKQIFKQIGIICLVLVLFIGSAYSIYKLNESFAVQTNYMGTTEWYKDFSDPTIDTQNKQIILKTYTGSATEVTVPASVTISGVKYQTVIGSGVFKDRDDITKVTFLDGVKGGESLANLFSGCTNLSAIEFNNFDTSATTNMERMFASCSSLKSVDLSSFNTSNVTSMDSMFKSSGILELDLSNFNTSNVTNMREIFYGTSCTYLDLSSFDTRNVTSMGSTYTATIKTIKIGPNMDFKTSEPYTAGSFGRGIWEREEDGNVYDAVAIAINSSNRNIDVSGTYTKVGNFIEEMNVDFDVDYRIEKVKKIDRYETTNNNFVVDNDKTVYITNLTATGTPNYTVPGSITLYFNDAVSDINDNKYNLKITLDNLTLYDINRVEEGYNTFTHAFFGVTSRGINLTSYFRPEVGNTTKIYETSSSAYDLTLEVIDDSGNAVNGKYIFSAYDIDIKATRNETNYYNPDYPGYGDYSEGINLISGFTTSTLKKYSRTFLQQNGTRITGTRVDGASELSEFIIQANAKKTKFTWTGQGCATAILNQYQPRNVNIVKQDNAGHALAGATLVLKNANTNRQIDSWESTTSAKTFFLNPGDYIVQEISAPDGYKVSSKIRFSVGEDLTINDEEVSEIVVKDVPKKYQYTIYHVEKANPENVLGTETGTAEFNSNVTVAEKQFAGYIYDSKDKTKILITTDPSQNIAYVYYIKVSAGVLEKHIDIHTNEILYNESHTGNVGDPYNIASREFEGYDLVEDRLPTNSQGEMRSELIEVIYYYAKKAKVISKYIDKETGEELADEEIINGHVDEDYQTEEKDIPKYQMVEIKGKPEGKMTEEDIEVIYYYEKIKGHSPQTGDTRNIVLWTALSTIGIIGIAVTTRYLLKKKI